jgi:hypothetical protein
VAKDDLGDHGLVASEEVFAFGPSQTNARPAAKAAPIIEARPVANVVQVTQQKTPSAKVTTVTAKKAGPVARVLQATVKRRPFTAAADSMPPKPAPSEKAVQASPPATVAATAIQAIAPQATNPSPSAAPVTSQAAPVMKPEPAIIPPKVLEITDRVLLESPRSPDLPRSLPYGRQLKTAAELATIIERDLAQHPDTPKQGLRVTVYGGASDWRAMLTILPAAGRVRNAQQLRELTAHLAERLRQRYLMAWE